MVALKYHDFMAHENSIFLGCTIYCHSFWLIDATVSLSQLEYLVEESNNSVMGNITLNSIASIDVTIEVTISDGSANGNVKY